MNCELNRPRYLRRGIGLLLACLLLWQQVAIAGYGCTGTVSAAPAAAQICASPHDSGCDMDRAACSQHCVQVAVKLHDAAVYTETYFPSAICPHAPFLQSQPLVAGAGLVADAAGTPYGGIPSRLLYCSLQI